MNGQTMPCNGGTVQVGGVAVTVDGGQLSHLHSECGCCVTELHGSYTLALATGDAYPDVTVWRCDDDVRDFVLDIAKINSREYQRWTNRKDDVWSEAVSPNTPDVLKKQGYYVLDVNTKAALLRAHPLPSPVRTAAPEEPDNDSPGKTDPHATLAPGIMEAGYAKLATPAKWIPKVGELVDAMYKQDEWRPVTITKIDGDGYHFSGEHWTTRFSRVDSFRPHVRTAAEIAMEIADEAVKALKTGSVTVQTTLVRQYAAAKAGGR